MNSRCIYCGIDHDLSESDIIPDALTNARIFNRNVCRIEHNNKFSDMFEGKVISALAFITNELDIKSSKGKNYAPYDAFITIEDSEYSLKLRGDNDVFNGRVIKSTDSTQLISSYDKAVKIAGDESKVHKIDVNTIEIEKRVIINNEIYFDNSMYRMLSKIAFEWYCSKNNVSEYCKEFKDIIEFIETGNGDNPVSIIQEEEIYNMIDQQVNLGSHTLLAFEKNDGEIDVVIYLFGLLMYRVAVTKKRPDICQNNFLYAELKVDSSRTEIIHESTLKADEYILGFLNSDNFVKTGEKNGVSIMVHQSIMNHSVEAVPDVALYTILFNVVKYLSLENTDSREPNEAINKIFIKRLNEITQSSTLQKKSIKRFVNETFCDGHGKIKLNENSSNKKATVLFYVIYLIGLSDECLDDKTLQKILKSGLPCSANNEFVVDDALEEKLLTTMISDKNYPDILEKGASKVKNWQS